MSISYFRDTVLVLYEKLLLANNKTHIFLLMKLT